MIPTVSQVCTLQSSFETDIEGFSQAGLQSIEIWLTKLERFLATHSIDDARQLLADNSMTPAVASLQGGLFSGPGPDRDESWSLFAKRMQLCRQLEIETIVVALDIKPPCDLDDIRSGESLQRIANIADECGVRVALEFQSQAAFGNNLQTAAALVGQVNRSCLGICLDAFHFFTGPSKLSDLNYLNQENLFHVQLADLADVPREIAADSDRIVPGDGDFELSAIMNHLRSINFPSCVSMELMNPRISQIPAHQVGDVGRRTIERLAS